MHVCVHSHCHQIPIFLLVEIRACPLRFPPPSSASPGQPLDLSKRLEFAMDIARGMACLHAQRPIIIHRDLKTANLLVSARFEIKVADFGLSRIKDASHVRAHRGSGVAGVIMLGCFVLSAVLPAGSTYDLSSLPHLKSVARKLVAADGTSPSPAKFVVMPTKQVTLILLLLPPIPCAAAHSCKSVVLAWRARSSTAPLRCCVESPTPSAVTCTPLVWCCGSCCCGSGPTLMPRCLCSS